MKFKNPIIDRIPSTVIDEILRKTQKVPVSVSYEDILSMIDVDQTASLQRIEKIIRKRTRGPIITKTKSSSTDLEVLPATLSVEKAHILLSKDPMNALINMNKMFSSQLGYNFTIESGYRSYAYQLVLFLRFFKYLNYDLSHTMSLIAAPGFSEHNDPIWTAVDFYWSDTSTGFDASEVFNWLHHHAQQHGFYLSFPKDHDGATDYEPWHWRYHGQ